MHRVSSNLAVIADRHLAENIKGKVSDNFSHAFVHPGIVTILLHELSLEICVPKVLAIIGLNF